VELHYEPFRYGGVKGEGKGGGGTRFGREEGGGQRGAALNQLRLEEEESRVRPVR
jgi:hypothetical protein